MRGFALSLLLAISATAAHASVSEVWQRTRWGETGRALADAFGARATVLDRPIEYGDAEVRVVLRGAEIGGHAFAVYFQEDRAGGGLVRIHFERPRHGAVLGVFRDVAAALEAEFGAPTRSCTVPPRAAAGFQAAIVRIWAREAGTVRAVFRDTTIESTEGCLREDRSATSPCGLTGQIFVQITASAADAARCF
jgi:hypothetical protein